MTSEERKYTLREAERELALEKCRMQGHGFIFDYLYGSDVPDVRCHRCGRIWKMVEVKK